MPGEDDTRGTRDLRPYRSILHQFETAWAGRAQRVEELCISDFLSGVPACDEPCVRQALESLVARLQSATRDKDSAEPGPAETLAPADLSNQECLTTLGAASPPAQVGPDSTMVGSQIATSVGNAGATRAVDVDSTAPTFDSSGVSPRQTLDPSTAARPSLKPKGLPTSFDDYELIGELGRGGMGVVYKALEMSTQRVVCVKMMLGGGFASPEARRRFQIETEAAASLDHPNIVPIFRTGVVNEMPYFAMRFVDGKAMDSIDRNEFKNNPRKGIGLIAKICRAVEFAHSRGILHRDLKPANILLDKNGDPHITDFGLAKKMDDDSGQTRTGLIMGTPDYMSPEQAVGAHELVSVTSDVYSLGSICFDMLTGQPPFKSATIVETLSRVTKEPARTPTTLNQRVGKDLETICLKCLEKDPAKRYRSAASLADELDRYLRGEPILARPVGSAEKLWRWCRRKPGLAAMSAMLLVMLVTAAVGSTIAAYLINERRNDAVLARGEADVARQIADAHAEQAERNAKIAEEQRTLALDTLHNLVTKVEEKLRDRADLADLQQDVLRDALQGLQTVSRTAENSGRADRTVGVAHQRMADILERLGRSRESVQEHQKAIAIFESLYRVNAQDDWAKWDAAISYDKLGDRQRSADDAAALEFYRQSLALREQLAATSHDDHLGANKRQRALIISAGKLGSLELQQGRPSEARVYFEKTLQQSESMLENDGTNTQAKLAVAGSCSLLGTVSFSLGDLAATREYYQRALKMREELRAEDPASVDATVRLAGSYDAIGDLELKTGHAPEAQRHYRSATTLLEELYANDAHNAKVKNNLSTMYYKLAATLLRLDAKQSAQRTFERCMQLREELLKTAPDDPDTQISVMLARARCGFHEGAVELAQQLSGKASQNAGSLVQVACGYALSAGSVLDSHDDKEQALYQVYAQSAVDSLQKALDLGYRDVVTLNVDPDLDPIREDPQFKGLLTRMSKLAAE